VQKENQNQGKQKDKKLYSYKFIVGILFLGLAVSIAIITPCPSNIAKFIIYSIVGIGLPLIFVKSADKSTFKLNTKGMAFSVAGAISISMFLIVYDPIGKYKDDNCILPLTIIVHVREKNKNDKSLQRQGYILMNIINGETKRALINENNEAFFSNLRESDKAKFDIDFSEPYKPIFPDSIYEINGSNKIDLQIRLSGIEQVFGKVLFREQPLSNVKVEIGRLNATTDSLGNYHINIPDSLQSKEYKVWFSKSGFTTIYKLAYPQGGESLDVVMEKSIN
jgi:hypothetical protein